MSARRQRAEEREIADIRVGEQGRHPAAPRRRASRCCPYCQQPLPDIRLGVRLTPLKAHIFDLVQRSGDDGIDRHDLFDIVYGDGDAHDRANKTKSFLTLKAHINQINELIEDQGYKIIGRSAVRLVRWPR